MSRNPTRLGRQESLLWSGCLLCLWLVACSHAPNRETLRREQVSHADEVHAGKFAPELFSRYQEATRLAVAEKPSSDAKADYETEARLWLEAAVAEAERVQASDARLALERETTTFEAAALDNERARVLLAEQAEHQAARELLRQEEELVLSRAALAPQKRVKLAPPEVEEAAEALMMRASLVLLALRAYELPEARLSGVTAKLAGARASLKSAPDDVLRQADVALFTALALLSEVRASQESAVNELAKASLAEAVQQSNAKLARNDRGLSAVVVQAYAQQELTVRAERILERLCAIAIGAPDGPVQLDVQGRTLASAEARAKRVRGKLAKSGCAGSRFQTEAVVSQAEELEVTWLAY